MRFLLRSFANAFHFAVAAFLGGVGFVIKESGSKIVNLNMLPWKDDDLVPGLFLSCGLGILAVLLNVSGKFPWMLPVNCFLLAFVLHQGYFFKPYTFDGLESFQWAAVLVAGAWGAFLSSLVVFKRAKKK
jgi:hypothetical protein